VRATRVLALVAALLAFPGAAEASDPIVLHEPIAPDPAEDLTLHVALSGDLPAAIQTPGGVVGAPDPLRPPTPWDPSYGVAGTRQAFTPDTDTRRPEVADYDDPFTPSTAPFKRLDAFDAVVADYHLEVRDPRLVRLAALQGGAPPSAEEDAFYADLVVDIPPEGNVRIPSVGPGARVVRARLGVGETPVPFQILRDGADNWFLQPMAGPGSPRALGANGLPRRARLVMEVAIARAAFGGVPGDVGWSELPLVAPLPENVARDAAVVRASIGVSRAMRPRDAIAKLVDYFRGFTDSSEAPAPRGSVYLDLALSKKGVCRHRAYAFLITAQSLGIPARLVENEAHAWVEIHDGTLWRRIDLGGAGLLPASASNRLAQRQPYQAPPEAFPWPHRADRGADMIAGARSAPGAGGSGSASSTGGATGSTVASPRAAREVPRRDGDLRPPSTVSVTITDAVVHRGIPLHVRGTVRADGEPCAHVVVELSLREPTANATKRIVAVGTLATGDDGAFEGAVVPAGVPLGDYELLAETPGDARCGRGGN
jgi:transglutaminase-like putative cysteine protease